MLTLPSTAPGPHHAHRRAAAGLLLLLLLGTACDSAPATPTPLAPPPTVPTSPLPTAPPAGPAFGNGGKVTTDMGGSTDQARALVIASDGKIVVAGNGRPPPDHLERAVLARYRPDGTFDPTFGDGGWTVTVRPELANDSTQGNALALQADGKIILAGIANNPAAHHNTFAVSRYNSDGSLDTGFGAGGRALIAMTDKTGAGADDIAQAVAVDGAGNILVAGSAGGFPADLAVARLQPDGQLDTAFGVGGKWVSDLGGDDGAHALVVAPDGAIFVAGQGSPAGHDFAVLRLSPAGQPDPAFGTNGLVITDFMGGQDWATGLALLPDGKIVAAGPGELPCPSGCNRWGIALAQYDRTGRLDPGFGDGGQVHTDLPPSSGAYGLARAADGGLVVAGHVGDADFVIVRYRANGTLAADFGTDGVLRIDFTGGTDRAYAVALGPAGQIYAAGEANVAGGTDTQFDWALYRP